jgi:hypothetical protein
MLVVFGDRIPTAQPLPGLVEDGAVLQSVAGDWSVRFTPNRGAPDHQVFPRLISWTEDSDPGVRHYSGTAAYEKDLNIGTLPQNRRVILDLGQVNVIATISVNGRPIATVWQPPYAADITDAVHSGSNHLEVKVANLWVNRLIADSGLPVEQRITWTTINPFHPDGGLLPSGLVGPVVLRLDAPTSRAAPGGRP